MAKKAEARLTGGQLRAARVLLGLTIAEVAEMTKLGERTVKRAEQGDEAVRITTANEDRLVSVLTEAGVEFIHPNGGGRGVRLRDESEPPKKQSTSSGGRHARRKKR
ncbi:MAG: helix-turn-helix domain-containing protein [Rhizomicrobium sp.]